MDGTTVVYGRGTTMIIERYARVITLKPIRSVGPRNGIQLRHGVPRPIVAETALNRNMTVIVNRRSVPTYTFPRTVKTVGLQSFYGSNPILVRFNEGLETLGDQCF